MKDTLRRRLRMARPGDVMSFDLHETFESMPDLREGLALLYERETVVEDSKGRRSDNPADVVEMVCEACQWLRKGPPEYARKAAIGKTGRPKAIRRMSEDVARGIWFDRNKYETNEQALIAMTDWSKSAAYSTFGPSGRRARITPTGKKKVSK